MDPEEIFLDLDEGPQHLVLWLAICVSLIFHLVLFLSIPSLVSFWPKPIRDAFMSEQEMLKDQNLTFLQMPPDRQTVTERPKTNIISDKDRIASSRHPETLSRKQMKDIVEQAAAGRPGAPGQPNAAPAPPANAQSATPTAPAPAGAGQNGLTQPNSQNQMATLQSPPIGGGSKKPGNVFGSGGYAGTTIDQATRAAAASRGVGGSYGDYGIARRSPANVQSDFEITTDTMGVDFSSYLSRVKQEIYDHWILLIPEAAYPPLRKSGKVMIQFAILKDGSVAALAIQGPSGDVSLDRAAYGGISASNPFPPLPQQFGGQFIGLRCIFYYNPSRAELQ